MRAYKGIDWEMNMSFAKSIFAIRKSASMRFPTVVFYVVPGALVFAVAAYVGLGGTIGQKTAEQSAPENAAVSTAPPALPAVDAAPAPTANDTPTTNPPRPAAQLEGPECRVVNYFDQNGTTVSTPQPIAGLMLAGAPITGPVDVPGAVRREVGGIVECPKTLIDQVQGLFDDSCFSDIQRKKTSIANNVNIDTVNKRCADMGEALHPRTRQ